MVKGSPTVMAAACKAPNASLPPPNNNAAAITPSIAAQNILCGTGTSTLPPAVILSMTKEPESDEVTKKINTKTIAKKEVTLLKGKFSNI